MSDLKHIESNSKVVAVRLPLGLVGQIEAAIAGTRSTKSGMIRAILENHFGEIPQPEPEPVRFAVEDDMWESMI